MTTSCACGPLLQHQNERIQKLEVENDELKERIAVLEKEKADAAMPRSMKRDGKTWSTPLRMMVFDFVTCNVATQNIPLLIVKTQSCAGRPIESGPQRSAVEDMVRQLGILSDFQAAEALVNNENLTVGFDATTQDGDHINTVYITTEKETYAVAIDELPGGLAVDYVQHLQDSIDHLAAVYSTLAGEDFGDIKAKMNSNIR
jgi:hypothetical protein